MEVSLTLEPGIRTRLRNSELLAQLSEAEFDKLWSRAQPVKLDLGDLISTDSPAQINLLASGKVRVVERLPDGEEINICTVENPGECWADAWLRGTGAGVIIARASTTTVILQAGEALSDLAAEKDDFSNHLISERERWEIYCVLRLIAPFGSIAPAKLRTISRYFKKISQGAKETEWARQVGLHVIIKGTVECTDNAGATRVLNAGDAVITGDFGPYHATAPGGEFRVNEPAEMLVLKQEDFADLADHSPDLSSILWEAVTNHRGADQSAASLQALFAPPITTPVAPRPPENAQDIADEWAPSRVNRFLHQYPFIMQQSQMDCGITCIAMVALFYGKRLDINELRDRAGVSAEGTSLLALAETAEHVS